MDREKEGDIESERERGEERQHTRRHSLPFPDRRTRTRMRCWGWRRRTDMLFAPRNSS